MEDTCDVDERFQLLLTEAEEKLVDDAGESLELPSYYDGNKFRLGQQLFFNNVFVMMITKLSGLLTLLSIPSILEILIFTKQSGTPCTAFRRYVSTILHTFVWYEKTPDQQSAFFHSLKNVRKKHFIASRRSAEAGLHKISQRDMAFTQFGFMGFTLLCGEELGVKASREEIEGLVHFWRVIGYLLGTDERYNLCSGSVEETRAICRRLLDDVILPCLTVENKDFERMGGILLEGLWPVVPCLNPEAFKLFTLQLASSAASNNNHSIKIDMTKVSIMTKICLEIQHFVLRYLMPTRYWWSTIFRAFFNILTRNAIFLTEHFPFLAYYAHGIKKSHVNIYKYHFE